MGGGRKSNCSILEAFNIIESLTNIFTKKEVKKENRVGDHIWYVQHENLKAIIQNGNKNIILKRL